jgi:hypothetical protein
MKITLAFGGHCGTWRKAAGSIPDEVIEIIHWLNPSGRTMALGVDSGYNINEYQDTFCRYKGGRCVRLTTLPLSFTDCLEIPANSTSWTLWVLPLALGQATA